MTKILVVDDSQVDRCLIRGLLVQGSNWHVEMAEGGKQALASIAAEPPDLIVTDLVMPQMDGLELLRSVNRQYLDIPVVLLTAHGNESIAVEALESGAASYVPKSQQAERLMPTIRRVLQRATTDRRRGRLDRCVLEYQMRLALDNDPAIIRALVDQVQRKMASVQFSDTGERIRVSEAFEEALLNAMYHGNLEISEREMAEARADLSGGKLKRLVERQHSRSECRDRKITTIVNISTMEVRFVIRDEGKGFNRRWLADQDLTESFEGGKHRGLTLIQAMMDGVSFNDAGNELTMYRLRMVPQRQYQLQGVSVL